MKHSQNLDVVNREILNKGFFLIGLFTNILYYFFVVGALLYTFIFLYDLGIFLGFYDLAFFYNDVIDGEKINIIKNDFFTIELGFFGFYLYFFFIWFSGIFILYYFKGLISSFRKGKVFTEKNLKRVKILNYINILFLFLGIFMSTIEEWLTYDISYFIIFLILFKVYVVGYEIHKEKQKLEEENNLTI